MEEKKKSVFDGLAAPDYEGEINKQYESVNAEVERQERQARANRHAAILGDMARLWSESSHAKAGGWGIKEREPMTAGANERLEKIKQGKAAMKAQYAKDRAAARQNKFKVDVDLAQARQQQENWQQTFDAGEAARRDAIDFRNKQFEYQKEQDAQKQKNINREMGIRENEQTIKQARIDAAAAKARGRTLDFQDGDGKVQIYENVWKASMPQVYEIIKQNLEKEGNSGDAAALSARFANTAAQQDNAVKMYWRKYPESRALMYQLANIDPAMAMYGYGETAGSAGAEPKDYSQYKVGEKKDYSQYKVNK